MVFGHTLSWYVRFIRIPLLVAGIILIALELAGRVSRLVGISLALATPISWLVTLAASMYVGQQIGKTEHRLFQSMVGGALLGIGIGIVHVGISIFRKITYVRPELFGIFGGFDIFFLVGSEIIITSFLASVGAILVGAQVEDIKQSV